VNGIGPVLIFATIVRLATALIVGGEGAPTRVPGMVIPSGKACIATGDKA
jgi:hypothetical protein